MDAQWQGIVDKAVRKGSIARMEKPGRTGWERKDGKPGRHRDGSQDGHDCSGCSLYGYQQELWWTRMTLTGIVIGSKDGAGKPKDAFTGKFFMEWKGKDNLRVRAGTGA